MNPHEIIKKFSELYYDIIRGFAEIKPKIDERIHHKISFIEDDFVFVGGHYFLLFNWLGMNFEFDINNVLTQDYNVDSNNNYLISLQFLSDILIKNQIEMVLIYGRYSSMFPINYFEFLIEKEPIIVPRLKEIYEKYKK